MSCFTLANAGLGVELAAGEPRVVGYMDRRTGARLDGTGEGALSVNRVPRPWGEWQIGVEATDDAVSYDLCHAVEGWRLRWVFSLEETALVSRLAVVEDAAGTLRTIDLAQLPLLTVADGNATYWREQWRQGQWDAFDAPWPQPLRGTYAFQGHEQRLIKYGIPDPAAVPTVHACAFNGDLCAFVQSNYLHMPLLTRVLPSARFAERSEGYAIGLNTYQYRVRDKVMPPLEARVVLLADINGDGIADECDYALWLNRQFPDPDPLYKERLWHKVFQAQPPRVTATFAQALEVIAAVYHVTDGLPQMTYLTGWQYDGHDEGFPSHDKLNERLGTRDDLLALIREAKERYNCLISYHINVDDTYRENPGWDESVVGRDIDGELMRWQVFNGKQSYHITHTKDVESGKIFEKMQAMFDLIPVERTIHLDAFRYYNYSWEPDGFIGPMEELVCGIKPIIDFFRERGIDISTEATDGWAMESPGWFSGVWHMDSFARTQLYHGKLLGGGRNTSLLALGMGGSIDDDLSYHRLETDWPRFLDFIFLGSMLYRFYLQREMVEQRAKGSTWYLRFGDGVETRIDTAANTLCVTWGELLIAEDGDRCIPVDGGIYLYSRDGGHKRWLLPEEWRGVPVEIYSLSRSGRFPAPQHTFTADSIEIDLLPRVPVRIMRKQG